MIHPWCPLALLHSQDFPWFPHQNPWFSQTNHHRPRRLWRGVQVWRQLLSSLWGGSDARGAAGTLRHDLARTWRKAKHGVSGMVVWWCLMIDVPYIFINIYIIIYILYVYGILWIYIIYVHGILWIYHRYTIFTSFIEISVPLFWAFRNLFWGCCLMWDYEWWWK